MQLLKLTLDTPDENLALDEALLETAETSDPELEYLRLWEPDEPFVVIGRSSRIQEEVQLETCRQQGIPVLRRCSGGAAIVAGRGCLMYALVLSYQRHPQLRLIEQAHQFVLGRLAAALGTRVALPVQRKGTSDLAVGDRKFSGNSLRCRRSHLLYHGTLLYDFPLDRISELLGTAPRQPDYRQDRTHREFVMNLPVPLALLEQGLFDAFPPTGVAETWPLALTRELARNRYQRAAWNEWGKREAGRGDEEGSSCPF